MTRPTLRRTSAAAVAVLALACLAACGDDDGGDGGENSSAEAGTGSGNEPSDGSSGDATDDAGDESDDPGDGESEAEAEEDAGKEIEPDEFIDLYLDAMDKATTAMLEASFGGTASIQGTGSADFTTTPLSMQLTMSDESTGQDQEMIIVDGTMYIGLQPKQYMEFDLSDPNSHLGTDLTGQLDPKAMAEVFDKHITDAAYLGEEDVEGEPMEHYRVTLDPTALLGDADLPLGAPSDAGAGAAAFDVWFDAEGNLRRQRADLGETGSAEMSYANWGEPVDIKAPPKSQITKLPGA